MYAVMPYFWAISVWLSTLTFVKVTLEGRDNWAESCSYMGAICLHGPHQSA